MSGNSAIKEVRDRLESHAPAAKRSGHLSYFDEEIAKIDTKGRPRTGNGEILCHCVANWAKANGVDPGDILLGEFGMIRQEYGNTHVVPRQIPQQPSTKRRLSEPRGTDSVGRLFPTVAPLGWFAAGMVTPSNRSLFQPQIDLVARAPANG